MGREKWLGEPLDCGEKILRLFENREHEIMNAMKVHDFRLAIS